MKNDVFAGLNAMAKECHRISEEHGWWDKSASFERATLMCHSEISEAVDEYRNYRPAAYVARLDNMGNFYCEEDMSKWEPDEKPEGVGVEVGDCIIRLLDLSAAMGWDLEEIMRRKSAFNELRLYRHGGKAL